MHVFEQTKSITIEAPTKLYKKACESDSSELMRYIKTSHVLDNEVYDTFYLNLDKRRIAKKSKKSKCRVIICRNASKIKDILYLWDRDFKTKKFEFSLSHFSAKKESNYKEFSKRV